MCNCTCNAKFRRDQLQSIHTAKHYENSVATGAQATKKNPNLPRPSDTVHTQHSVIQEITKSITEHAKDAIIEVIQQGSPIKKLGWGNQSQESLLEEQVLIQRAIERSLGVTALSMAKDPMMAGNILLKNSLREEMGGAPTTTLSPTQETVSQYRSRRQRGHRVGSGCSRTARNNLVDLSFTSDYEEEVKTMKLRKTKMKKRVMIKMLKMYKDEPDKKEKAKIKYAMKAIDEKEENSKNEMIKFTFDVHTTELDSFDSDDAVTNILEFVDDADELDK